MEKNKKMFIIYLLGVFVGAMDNGIVNPALSIIGDYFSISENWGIWSFTIFTLSYAITVPITGKLADDYGGKFVAFFGISLFIVGLVLSCITSNYIIFLLGRVLQGIGGGSLIPIANAEVAKMFDKNKQGKALGIVGCVYSVSMVLGPLVGGLIINYLSWKWIFLINIPILILMWVVLLKDVSFKQKVKVTVDIRGALFLSLATLFIMIGITNSYPIAFIIGFFFASIFLISESKHKNPIINVKLLKGKNYSLVLLLSFLAGFLYVIPLIVPLIGENLFVMEAGTSGFLLIPITLIGVVSTLLGGMIVDVIGPKKTLILGFIIVLLSSSLLYLIKGGIPLFIISTMLFGLGGGIVIGSPIKTLIIQLSPSKYSNASISLVTLFRSIGTTVGGAVSGYLLAKVSGGIEVLFITAITMCIFCLLVLLLIDDKNQYIKLKSGRAA
ncbi:MFS transporter [Metabacillus bambusae]|uniref:MFS transporter n=1 Tax=Metabacillus bambusae TaxID=2795218 RepID=A0ABS3MYW4_9BACI|nr:MFS transporter [Metabacillus bambusae]MBO1511188.1 MFS transporter [Metabacillus bambusae]